MEMPPGCVALGVRRRSGIFRVRSEGQCIWPPNPPQSPAVAIRVRFFGSLGRMHDQAPPLWWLGSAPFAGLLASIAVLPLLKHTRHWWESNRNRLTVSLAFAAGTLVYYGAARGLGALPALLA